MPASRATFKAWHAGIGEVYKTANIKHAWQIMNADETMIAMEYVQKWTWASSRTQVAVAGLGLPRI